MSDYRAMVRRIQELVWEFVPAGAVVAVVSKGDPDLVTFDNRRGWHYPQTPSGVYVGHHPATGAEAVAHLESLRQRGAQYLVIPGTSSWWLDHYADLRRHLQAEGHVVHNDENGLIVALTRADPGVAPTSTAAEVQLRDLVSALLPDNCTLVAVGSAHPALAATGTQDVIEAAGVRSNTAPDDALLAMRGAGADYLVIPAGFAHSPGRAASLVERARSTCTVVTDQPKVCTIFALGTPATKG